MEFIVQDMTTLKAAVDAMCTFLKEQGVEEDCLFNSRLVANELLGNALKHAKATAKLFYELKDGQLHVTVCSSVAYTPPQKSVCSGVFAEHGRGLFLVDSVCVERILTETGGILVKIKIR